MFYCICSKYIKVQNLIFLENWLDFYSGRGPALHMQIQTPAVIPIEENISSLYNLGSSLVYIKLLINHMISVKRDTTDT